MSKFNIRFLNLLSFSTKNNFKHFIFCNHSFTLLFLSLFLLLLSSLLCSCDNVTVQSLKEDNQSLKTQYISLLIENSNLRQQIEDLNSQIETLQLSSIQLTPTPTVIPVSYTLSNGTYTVGSNADIPQGTYNLVGMSGYGLLTGDLQQGFISQPIGISTLYPENKTYSNLTLTTGDTFTIQSGVSIKFVLK